MFNNTALDVFIGLIFVFLLYSLLATILQEIIASRFALRARMLQKALRRMLEDDQRFKKSTAFGLFNFILETGRDLIRFFVPLSKNEMLLKKFYSHPTIKYLGEDKLFSKPSYLHSSNFSNTLIQLLRGNDYDGKTETESLLIKKALDENTLEINAETLNHLKILFADSRQDAYQFKQKLAEWFDQTMERTTGWYKRQNQWILMWVGFVIAGSFNVDTIAITRILINNKNAREQTLQLALNSVDKYGATIDTLRTVNIISTTRQLPESDTSIVTTTTSDTSVEETVSTRFLDSVRDDLRKDADALNGILGLKGITRKQDSTQCSAIIWCMDSLLKAKPDDVVLKKRRDAMYEACLKANENENASIYQKSSILKILGWLLTALAISLGAPFWFDLLNKFVKLRSAGTKPPVATTPDEQTPAPKDIRG